MNLIHLSKSVSHKLATGVLFALFAVATAEAGTLTWTGGASGDIAAAANWGGTAPQAGDTLVLSTATTLTGSFDFGSAGLTLDCSAAVTSDVAFSGSAVLTKQGSGELKLRYASTYSGGTLIEAGKVTLLPGTAAGTGTITVDRSTAGSTSIVNFEGYSSGTTTYPNDIHVKGTHVDVTLTGVQSEVNAVSQKAPIQLYYHVTLTGTIVGDGSIMIRNASTYDLTVNNTVTVPEGSMIAVDGRSGNADFTFKKEVLGSFTKFSSGRSWNGCTFSVPCGRASETLCVHEGSMYLSSSGQWRGSTVVITNLPFTQYKPNLNNSAKKSFRSDVSIYLATTCSFPLQLLGQTASHLFYNGVEQPAGYYVPGMLNGSLTGAGDLVVAPVVRSWTGGASGDIAAAANWGGTAPQAGDTLVLGTATTLTGSFDLGDAGLVIACSAAVQSGVAFSGSGALTKMGSAALTLNGESTYSGGTFVKGGKLVLYPAKAAGTGTITVDRSVSNVTSIAYFKGTNSTDGAKTVYPNNIYVKGTHVNMSLAGTQSAVKSVASSGPLQSYYDVQFDGTVTADGSIMYYNEYTRDVTFNNTVTVPEGSTIAVDGHNGNACCIFKKEVLGSLTKFSTGKAWNTMQLYAPCGRPGEVLTVHEGTFYLKTGGSWRGSTVVITNLPFTQYKPGLVNETKSAFRSDFSLYLATGCKFESQFSGQTASHLHYNGVEQPCGVYLPGMLDGALAGTQELIVGMTPSYWVGGRSGKWSVAANWDPAVVPGEGSVAIFTNVVYTEKESVDIGSTGIILKSTVNYSNARNQANVSNEFFGVGGLSKIGAGDVNLYGCSTYTGPTKVYHGSLRGEVVNAILPNPVTLYSESGTTPGFGSSCNIDVMNDVNIVGSNGAPHLITSNCTRYWGHVTSEDDFEIDNSWGSGMNNQSRILGGIDAPGKTVTIAGWDYVTSTSIESDVNASVYKNYSIAPSFFKSGTIGSRSAKLTITAGTNYVYEAARIAITNIVLSKSSASTACCAMKIESGKSIDPDSEFRLGAGTMLIIPQGTRVRIARLFVDGVEQPIGNYRAAGNPTWLGGKGVLSVGPKQGMVLLLR